MVGHTGISNHFCAASRPRTYIDFCLSKWHLNTRSFACVSRSAEKRKKKRTHIERPTAHVRRTTPTTQLDEIKLDGDAYLGALHSGLNLNLIINLEVYLLDHKTVKKRQVVLCVCVSCVCFFVCCVQRRLCSKNHSNRQTWASMGRLLPISFAYKLWEFIKSGS